MIPKENILFMAIGGSPSVVDQALRDASDTGVALGAVSYAVLSGVTGFLYFSGAGQRYRQTYRNQSYGRDEQIIRHERVPPTEAFAAGLLWPLVLGFAFCIGFARMSVRLIRLGPLFKREVNMQLKGTKVADSTAVVVHGGKEEVPWYE